MAYFFSHQLLIFTRRKVTLLVEVVINPLRWIVLRLPCTFSGTLFVWL